MLKFFKLFLIVICLILNQYSLSANEENKIKIGLLVPITGDNKDLGYQIIKSTRTALKDINTGNIEIYLKDTGSDPNITIKSANALVVSRNDSNIHSLLRIGVMTTMGNFVSLFFKSDFFSIRNRI